MSDTHTYKDTQHTLTNRLTHPYKYTLIPSAMCSQQLSALHWIIHWYQKFSFQCLLFKNYSLVEVVYMYIRCNKTKFFLCSTNDTDKNGVDKQNTHTHTHQILRERLHWKERWGSNYEPGCFWNFVFDSAKEASNDVTTFLNLRFITKQKLALFWENITC